jgi:hypothetical protein
MIIPDEAEIPRPPSKVFALATPHHLLIKLHWELVQLRSSLEAKLPVALTHVPAYHSFNVAVTCWHLTDWTWASADQQTRLLISQRLDLTEQTLGQFQRALRRKHRVLHICSQIANGSKHFHADRTDDPEIRTEDVWEHQPLRAGSARAGHRPSYRYRLVVTDKGEPHEAITLFEQAERIWIRELESWFIIEGQSYITGKPLAEP